MGGVVFIAAATLLVACADVDTPDLRDDAFTSPTRPLTGLSTSHVSLAEATDVVGVDGGTLSLPGVTLTIPSGALTSDVPITLREVENLDTSGHQVYSRTFEIAPAGVVFAIPATLTATFRGGPLAPAFFWSDAGVAGATFAERDISPSYQKMATATVQVSGGGLGFIGAVDPCSSSEILVDGAVGAGTSAFGLTPDDLGIVCVTVSGTIGTATTQIDAQDGVEVDLESGTDAPAQLNLVSPESQQLTIETDDTSGNPVAVTARMRRGSAPTLSAGGHLKIGGTLTFPHTFSPWQRGAERHTSRLATTVRATSFGQSGSEQHARVQWVIQRRDDNTVVRTLESLVAFDPACGAACPPAVASIDWDGRDETGERVAPGFYRVVTDVALERTMPSGDVQTVELAAASSEGSWEVEPPRFAHPLLYRLNLLKTQLENESDEETYTLISNQELTETEQLVFASVETMMAFEAVIQQLQQEGLELPPCAEDGPLGVLRGIRGGGPESPFTYEIDVRVDGCDPALAVPEKGDVDPSYDDVPLAYCGPSAADPVAEAACTSSVGWDPQHDPRYVYAHPVEYAGDRLVSAKMVLGVDAVCEDEFCSYDLRSILERDGVIDPPPDNAEVETYEVDCSWLPQLCEELDLTLFDPVAPYADGDEPPDQDPDAPPDEGEECQTNPNGTGECLTWNHDKGEYTWTTTSPDGEANFHNQRDADWGEAGSEIRRESDTGVETECVLVAQTRTSPGTIEYHYECTP